MSVSKPVSPLPWQGSKCQSVELSSSKKFTLPTEKTHGIPLWDATADAWASDNDHYQAQKLFLDGWASRIEAMDPKFFQGCGNDPHIYLI